MSDRAAIQYATFHLADYYFGIDVLQVQEILRLQRMTRVPLASSVVEGLLNLRGQIVTAIDLRRRLELPPREDGLEPTNIVIRTDDGPMAFLIDEIGDVIEVDERSFEEPPETLAGPARSLITGIYKLEEKLLLVLDVEEAANVNCWAAAS